MDLIQAIKNQGGRGGFQYIQNCTSQENIIKNTLINSNIAISSGGGIYSLASEINVLNTTIIQNQAQIGGGIRFLEKIPSCLQISNELYSQRILQNLNIYNFIQDLELSNNQAFIFGDDFANWINNLDVLYQNQYINEQNPIPNIRSGQVIELQILLYDQFNKLIQWNNDQNINEYQQYLLEELDQIIIQFLPIYQEESVYLSGDTYQNARQLKIKNNQILISIQIYGVPGEVGYFSVNLQDLIVLNLQKMTILKKNVNEQIPIKFRYCQAGELYQIIEKIFYECSICPKGTYSFEVPSLISISEQECTTCTFQGSNSCEANQVYMKNGYWRESPYDLQYFECNQNPQNNYCAAEESESRNYCINGHIGPLCKECDTYGEIWEQQYTFGLLTSDCISCQDSYNIWIIFQYLIFVIIELWFIQFSIQNAIKSKTSQIIGNYLRKTGLLNISNSCYVDLTPFYVKQFFHYMALQRFCQKIKIQGSFLEVLNFFPKIFSSPINIFYNMFDCAFSQIQGIEMFYLRIIWSQLIPLVYLGLIYIIFAIFIKYNIIRNDRKYFTICKAFLTMYLSPGIINILLKSMLCQQIGLKGQAYIQSDFRLVCQSDTHIYFTLFLLLPLFIIWGFLIPLYFFLKVKKLYKQQRQNWYKDSIQIGFLYSEFTPESYYWEFVKMFEKFCVILINTVELSQDQAYLQKLSLTAIIILIYMIAVFYYQPYKKRRFQQIDYTSSIILLVSISMNIIYTYNNDEQSNYSGKLNINWLSQLAKVLGITIDQVYFFILFFSTLIVKFTTQNRVQIIKFKEKYIFNEKYKYQYIFQIFVQVFRVNKPRKWRVFKNWKKAHQKIIKYIKSPEYQLLKRKKKKTFLIVKKLNQANHYEQNENENINQKYNKNINNDNQLKVFGKIEENPEFAESLNNTAYYNSNQNSIFGSPQKSQKEVSKNSPVVNTRGSQNNNFFNVKTNQIATEKMYAYQESPILQTNTPLQIKGPEENKIKFVKLEIEKSEQNLEQKQYNLISSQENKNKISELNQNINKNNQDNVQQLQKQQQQKEQSLKQQFDLQIQQDQRPKRPSETVQILDKLNNLYNQNRTINNKIIQDKKQLQQKFLQKAYQPSNKNNVQQSKKNRFQFQSNIISKSEFLNTKKSTNNFKIISNFEDKDKEEQNSQEIKDNKINCIPAQTFTNFYPMESSLQINQTQFQNNRKSQLLKNINKKQTKTSKKYKDMGIDLNNLNDIKIKNKTQNQFFIPYQVKDYQNKSQNIQNSEKQLQDDNSIDYQSSGSIPVCQNFNTKNNQDFFQQLEQQNQEKQQYKDFNSSQSGSILMKSQILKNTSFEQKQQIQDKQNKCQLEESKFQIFQKQQSQIQDTEQQSNQDQVLQYKQKNYDNKSQNLKILKNQDQLNQKIDNESQIMQTIQQQQAQIYDEIDKVLHQQRKEKQQKEQQQQQQTLFHSNSMEKYQHLQNNSNNNENNSSGDQKYPQIIESLFKIDAPVSISQEIISTNQYNEDRKKSDDIEQSDNDQENLNVSNKLHISNQSQRLDSNRSFLNKDQDKKYLYE